MNPFVAIRAGYGTALLLVPDRVVRLYSGRPADRTTRTVARVLGARHLAQALGSVAPGRAVQVVGAEVDVLHSLSMLGLAAVDAGRRRVGLIDAAVAGSFAAAGVLLAARLPADGRPPPGLAGWRARVAAVIARYTLPAAVRRRLSVRPDDRTR